MSKKTTVELGGKTLQLAFNNFYFYKYFKEATGIDLYAASFELMQKADSRRKEVEAAMKSNLPMPEENGNSVTETRLYKMITTTDNGLYAAGLMYAGYAAEKSINREKIDLTFEDIEHSVYCLTPGEVSGLVDVYNKTTNEAASEMGEATSHLS